MACKDFRQIYLKITFLVFASLFPFIGNSTSEDALKEKRIGVAMRMIGHEVLKCYGDHESRVMPIEKNDDHYRIAFEFDFGFDPADIVSIIDEVMTKTGIGSWYIVQIEQCDTKKIVHSHEIRIDPNSAFIPCGGRMLPKDCYNLLLTITEPPPRMNSVPVETNTSILRSAFWGIPILLLVGLIFFLQKRKSIKENDPDDIAIGSFLFNQRTMILTFENTGTELSNKEARLLTLLHSSVNEPVNREVILQKVWGDEGAYVGRTLDVYISKLRKKLEADESVKIVNIRGVGYKLVVG